MNASHLTRLASIASDVVATDGGSLVGMVVSEYADGSGRAFALVNTYDVVNDLEQQYRILSPAPADAAPWARVHDSWQLELRVADRWMDLDLDEHAGVQL